MKKASINILKTFKNAFGENCDVFSNNSFEVVPKLKEDKIFKKSEPQITSVSQQNEQIIETLEQLIELVYFKFKLRFFHLSYIRITRNT